MTGNLYKVTFTVLGALLLTVLNNCGVVGEETDETIQKEIELLQEGLPIDILFNSAPAAPACTLNNSLKIEFKGYADVEFRDDWFCVVDSKFPAEVNEGEVCPGGPILKKLNSSLWVGRCGSLQVCGVQLTDLHQDSADAQFNYSNLPWGCQAKLWAASAARPYDELYSKLKSESAQLEVEQLQSPSDTFKAWFVSWSQNNPAAFEINVPVPACRYCESTQSETCNSCSSDNVAPKIHSVTVTTFLPCPNQRVTVVASDSESGLHRDGAFSFDGGVTWSKSAFKNFNTKTLSLATESIKVRDQAGNVTSHNLVVSGTIANCQCVTPWGQLAHGGSMKPFSQSSVTCGNSCATVQSPTDLVCNDGTLSGGVDLEVYKHSVCNITNCSCNTGWGDTIPYGSSRFYYKLQTSTDCVDNCNSATNRALVQCSSTGQLTTPDGFMKGEYPFALCSVRVDGCRCTLPGNEIINHGGKKLFYGLDKVSCGNSCTPIEVVCTGTNLSLDPTGLFSSCFGEPCGGAGGGSGGGSGDGIGFGGGKKLPGGPAPGSGSPGVNLRACLLPWAVHPVYTTTPDFTVDRYSEKCAYSLTNPRCVFWDQYSINQPPADRILQFVLSGEVITAFRYEVAPDGITCEDSRQKRVCVNGILTGNPEYKHLNCSEAD